MKLFWFCSAIFWPFPVKLQFLNLGNNKISALPSEFSKLENLREIVLAYNRFSEIPRCVFECQKLENLIVTGNQIREIDLEGLKR